MELRFHGLPSWNHEAAALYALSDHPLDATWVKDGCDKLSRTLITDGHIIQGDRALPPPDDLAAGAFAVLGGTVSAALKDLLCACIKMRFELPSTRPKYGGVAEPCGPTTTTHNLSPEWIRHFLGALYDKSQFAKSLQGREYFPFENRDHLVHSLTCALLGPVVLGLPPTPSLLAITPRLRIFRRRPTTVFDAIERFYRTDHPDWFTNLGANTTAGAWLKKAWIAASVWHDSGYDSATWYLLTAREFMHCHPVFSVQQAVSNSFRQTLIEVAAKLDGILYTPIQNAIGNACKHLDEGLPLYYVLWDFDGCADQDTTSRCWGRLHAILSAYEFFMSRSRDERQRADIRHLVAAIAEHHEQVHLRPKGSDMRQMQVEFRRNPMAALLALTDYLAGFHRVKMEAPSEFVATDLAMGLGRITFDMDVNSDPLWVQQKEPGDLRFFRGRKFENRDPDRYSVFGTIDTREKKPPKIPEALEGYTCPFGGCKEVP